MDHYAPIPTSTQLQVLSAELGRRFIFSRRIEGGLGCTMDVLQVPNGERVILRRYWPPEEGEVDPSVAETRALELAAAHGIPAPTAIWRDQMGLFAERAIVISFIEGRVLLEPQATLEWATQLAHALAAVHSIELGPEDTQLFPVQAPGEDDHVSEAAVLGHPRGRDLWEKRRELLARLQPTDPVYVHHDYWAGNTLWQNSQLVAIVDWEGGSVGDPALDVAYCAFDMRLLRMDEAAQHFVETYRQASGRILENLDYWNLMAVCRPLPDVANWVPGWNAMDVGISVAEARARHNRLIEDVLTSSSWPISQPPNPTT